MGGTTAIMTMAGTEVGSIDTATAVGTAVGIVITTMAIGRSSSSEAIVIIDY